MDYKSVSAENLKTRPYNKTIRNEREMDRIWCYTESNPLRWADDRENPSYSPP